MASYFFSTFSVFCFIFSVSVSLSLPPSPVPSVELSYFPLHYLTPSAADRGWSLRRLSRKSAPLNGSCWRDDYLAILTVIDTARLSVFSDGLQLLQQMRLSAVRVLARTGRR